MHMNDTVPDRRLWPRLLITGFEPFGTHAYNPSWDVAQAAASALRPSLQVQALLLEVQFAAAASVAATHLSAPLDELAGHTAPLWMVHVGLAAGREAISLERFAHNVKDDRLVTADRRDVGPGGERRARLLDDAPDRLHTGLDLDALARYLGRHAAAADLPSVEISEDCGAFVCNATYFHSLHAARTARNDRGRLVEALFVHVPLLTPERARDLGSALARALLELAR